MRDIYTKAAREKDNIGHLLEYMDFYGEQTADQIEWHEDTELEKKFITEAAVGATLFNIQHGQITRSKQTDDFFDEVNQILSEFYSENPVQISNLTTGGDRDLPWIPNGENSPYILEGSIEDYDHDIVIYRPEEDYRTIEPDLTGLSAAKYLGSIPQINSLNGLIKGLEDFER